MKDGMFFGTQCSNFIHDSFAQQLFVSETLYGATDYSFCKPYLSSLYYYINGNSSIRQLFHILAAM